MTDIVIKAENLGKKYTIGRRLRWFWAAVSLKGSQKKIFSGPSARSSKAGERQSFEFF